MRWRVADKKRHFLLFCERECAHIQIDYGDNDENTPLYGTRDQAKADADLICSALNARDTPSQN